MTTYFRQKQSAEAWAISFDFTDDLNGATISSVTSLIALDQADNSNVSTTVLDSTKQSNSDTVAYGWVRAGTSGHDYLITCIILASDASIYELEGILPVLDAPSAGAVGVGGTRIVTEPTIEPVTKAELETQLGISSGTMASDSTMYVSLPSGSYPTDYELMTLDVAPSTAWAVGDTITGTTSTKTCVVVHVLTTKTFIVKSKSGAFTLGEEVGVTGVPGKLATQGATKPTFATTYNGGYMALSTGIDVLGYTAVVYLTPVNNGTDGTVDVKIQEADVLAGPYTDWSTGGFTTVTEANDTVIQEKSYTGTKQYIRTVAKTLVAACTFGTSIMVWEPELSSDDFLNEIRVTAREYVEQYTSRQIMTATWDYCLKGWPAGNSITLPFGCLQSVTSISWKSTDGTVTTLVENTDYLVESNGDQCGKIVLPYGYSWPSGELYPSNPITIRYVCGWTTAAAVPSRIKSAIKRVCVNLYANRGDDVIGQSVTYDKTVDRLLSNARLWDMF